MLVSVGLTIQKEESQRCSVPEYPLAAGNSSLCVSRHPSRMCGLELRSHSRVGWRSIVRARLVVGRCVAAAVVAWRVVRVAKGRARPFGGVECRRWAVVSAVRRLHRLRRRGNLLVIVAWWLHVVVLHALRPSVHAPASTGRRPRMNERRGLDDVIAQWRRCGVHTRRNAGRNGHVGHAMGGRLLQKQNKTNIRPEKKRSAWKPSCFLSERLHVECIILILCVMLIRAPSHTLHQIGAALATSGGEHCRGG